MNTKICTDIEQSKKLVKILPLDSADMCYIKGRFTDKYLPDLKCYKYARELYADYIKIIPCWSLATLLDILKDNIKIEKTELDQSDMFTYSIVGDGYNYKTYEYKELIDACYEMIVKLHEKNELVL